MPPDGPPPAPAGDAAPLRVLIVEDDPAMAVALRDGFAYEGAAVRVAEDGAAGLRLAQEDEFDVLILDVMLPRVSGLDVCAELRRTRPALPIIMLTARDQEADKVQGLRTGADDYVTKPFSFVELLARVDAVRRRAHRQAPVRQARFGDVRIDFERLRASRDGAPFDLSPREFAILECLIGRRGQVVSREDLLRQVWGHPRLTLTRTVDMHIVKLRRKIEPDPSEPRYVVTVHGAGYKFTG
jgi:two-component system alkaline phosphatase synthesis response regulator PhoP